LKNRHPTPTMTSWLRFDDLNRICGEKQRESSLQASLSVSGITSAGQEAMTREEGILKAIAAVGRRGTIENRARTPAIAGQTMKSSGQWDVRNL
jgi:hypothetical protein